MKYGQLRVAALSNALHREPRAIDRLSLQAWHLWATRADTVPQSLSRVRWETSRDILRRAWLDEGPMFVERDYDPHEADHVRSYRSTYYTRSNLL